MSQFAKLFQYEDIGQVLVVIDQTEDPGKVGPEIRFSFSPPNLGVCAVKLNWEDTEEGWNKAEEIFGMTNEEEAYKVVKPQIDKFADAFGAEQEA